jgi:hypothetical protein
MFLHARTIQASCVVGGTVSLTDWNDYQAHFANALLGAIMVAYRNIGKLIYNDRERYAYLIWCTLCV